MDEWINACMDEDQPRWLSQSNSCVCSVDVLLSPNIFLSGGLVGAYNLRVIITRYPSYSERESVLYSSGWHLRLFKWPKFLYFPLLCCSCSVQFCSRAALHTKIFGCLLKKSNSWFYSEGHIYTGSIERAHWRILSELFLQIKRPSRAWNPIWSETPLKAFEDPVSLSPTFFPFCYNISASIIKRYQHVANSLDKVSGLVSHKRKTQIISLASFALFAIETVIEDRPPGQICFWSKCATTTVSSGTADTPHSTGLRCVVKLRWTLTIDALDRRLSRTNGCTPGWTAKIVGTVSNIGMVVVLNMSHPREHEGSKK